VGGVVCERTQLEGDPYNQRAVNTGIQEVIPAHLVLVSIGYKALLVPGTEQWFDSERGLLKNTHGRIEGMSSTSNTGGLYVSGWLKRGPTGIIGTNIVDAKETVASILQDVDANKIIPNDPPTTNLTSLLIDRGIPFVDWDGHQRIKMYEQTTKRSERQPREKITDIDKMLFVARAK
jgi:adrenodoxin-NADP+ reductase